MLKINFCKKENINHLINFLKHNWPQKSVLCKNRRLFNWLYYNKKNKNYNFLISQKNKNIFSCVGILKNNIKIRKKQSSQIRAGVLWMTMWISISNENYNLGTKLIYYLIKNFRNHFIGTVGCNNKVFPIYKALGFKTGLLNHYYLINPQIKKFNLVKITKNEKLPAKKNQFYIEISNNINFFKKNKQLKYYEKIHLKNFSYFKYKYDDNPFYTYKFYLIKKGDFIYGFFVGRVCSHNRKTALRLVEYFGSKKVLEKIKYSLKKILEFSNYEYIDFYNTGIKKKILKKAGFKLNKFKKNIVIPNYYEPFVRDNIQIRYAIWPKNNFIPIFKGDCDQDRPNKLL